MSEPKSSRRCCYPGVGLCSCGQRVCLTVTLDTVHLALWCVPAGMDMAQEVTAPLSASCFC